MSNIPWSKPYLDQIDSEFVLQALESTWISVGEFNQRLEQSLQDYLAVDNCLLTSNGTTALHLAFLGLGLQAGDKIGIPSYGYLAAANIATQMGLEICFYDVELNTFNCQLEELDRLSREKLKALVIVQNYGNVSEMDFIENWGMENGIYIIEDAAESLGSEYKFRKSGSFGDISTLSFHATKTITCGEGGAVTTKHHHLAERMKLIRSHGVGTKRYSHMVHGHNFRLTNMQAALGCSQLNKKEKIFELKNDIWKLYSKNLVSYPQFKFQEFQPAVKPIVWAVAIRIDTSNGPGRDELMQAMARDGIETRNGFYTPFKLQIYGNQLVLPNAEQLSSEILVLPSFAGLTYLEIERICESLISNWKL